MNNNKHQPKKDPIEKIKYWLIFGGIGLIAVLVIAVMIFEPREQNEQRQDTVRENVRIRQQGQQTEPAPIVLNEEERQRIVSNIEMVFVEGGTFLMGCTAEPCFYHHALPVQQVTLSGYYIGKYQVTQMQWIAVMGSNPSIHKGDNLPVHNVNWNDAQEFISKLNTATGKRYRLPTEAEWEYAARGGSKSKGFQYSGSNNINDVAWYNDNSGGNTKPVGTKAPNELGIYDMSGNVWEWCSDWFGAYTANAKTNPTGPSTGTYRVLRGGCWKHSFAAECRVAYRSITNPYDRGDYLGFRLVLISD